VSSEAQLQIACPTAIIDLSEVAAREYEDTTTSRLLLRIFKYSSGHQENPDLF